MYDTSLMEKWQFHQLLLNSLTGPQGLALSPATDKKWAYVLVDRFSCQFLSCSDTVS